MKVFVTGGTGFIGTHTCRALLDAGHTIKLFVRNREKAKRLFGTSIRSIAVGDIDSATDVKKALKSCDAAIHMAAMVSTSKDDAKKVYQTNLAAAENVLGLAAEAGCKKIIHVSSVTAIFNPKAKILNHNSPLGVANNVMPTVAPRWTAKNMQGDYRSRARRCTLRILRVSLVPMTRDLLSLMKD